MEVIHQFPFTCVWLVIADDWDKYKMENHCGHCSGIWWQFQKQLVMRVRAFQYTDGGDRIRMDLWILCNTVVVHMHWLNWCFRRNEKTVTNAHVYHITKAKSFSVRHWTDPNRIWIGNEIFSHLVLVFVLCKLQKSHQSIAVKMIALIAICKLLTRILLSAGNTNTVERELELLSVILFGTTRFWCSF